MGEVAKKPKAKSVTKKKPTAKAKKAAASKSVKRAKPVAKKSIAPVKSKKVATKAAPAKTKAKSAPAPVVVKANKSKAVAPLASTNGKSVTHKVSRPTRHAPVYYSSPTSQDPIQFPEDDARIPKTFLTSKQMQEFKQLLLHKRAELAGDVRQLTSEALNRESDHSGERSAMPIHLADLGSDNWEQEFTLGLIASERAVVREIDEALDRIVDGTYGMCIATHKPIGLARLQAKPWAKYSIEYARLRDEGRVP